MPSNPPTPRKLHSVPGVKSGSNIIEPGSRIRFIGPNDQVVSDTIRHIFWQETLSERGVALILTQHSWIWAKDVKGLDS